MSLPEGWVKITNAANTEAVGYLNLANVVRIERKKQASVTNVVFVGADKTMNVTQTPEELLGLEIHTDTGAIG